MSDRATVLLSAIWTAFTDERAKLKATLLQYLADEAEEDEACREAALRVLTPLQVNGDSHGVPMVSDVVELLVAEIELLRGAAAADERRLIAAAEKAGITYGGCDTPDDLAEEIERLNAEIEAEKLRPHSPSWINARLVEREEALAEAKRLQAIFDSEPVARDLINERDALKADLLELRQRGAAKDLENERLQGELKAVLAEIDRMKLVDLMKPQELLLKGMESQAELNHELKQENRALKAEIAEHDASFDLRWKADMRAIKRWQKATGKTAIWPDHADLCVWLLEQNDKLKATSK